MALATFLMALGFLFIFYKNKRIIFFVSIISILVGCTLIQKTHPFYNDF